jgi:GAF domain-containing protein
MPLSIGQIKTIRELKELEKSVLDQIDLAKIELLCPIMSRGKLISILALGRKLRGTAYDYEDIDLVRSMVNQAGVIVENAKLFSEKKH